MNEAYELAGLSDWPLIQTMADFFGIGMAEVDQAGDDMAAWMKKSAPNLARILLRAIPGTAPVADVIADAIKELIEGNPPPTGNKRPMAGLRPIMARPQDSTS